MSASTFLLRHRRGSRVALLYHENINSTLNISYFYEKSRVLKVHMSFALFGLNEKKVRKQATANHKQKAKCQHGWYDGTVFMQCAQMFFFPTYHTSYFFRRHEINAQCIIVLEKDTQLILRSSYNACDVFIYENGSTSSTSITLQTQEYIKQYTCCFPRLIWSNHVTV